jgi:mono/diheme cytochrome c family protein
MNNRPNRRLRIAAFLLFLIAIALGFTAWFKLYRDVPQPEWIGKSPRDTFLYGSIGTEGAVGMPYWIWLVLPRIFPEYMPYAGGYASLGMTWEEGREMPAGFSKKTVGYVRVAGNCALCHAASYRVEPDDTPQVVPAIPGHTVDLQPLLTFLKKCAQDERFNASELLAEIDMATRLSFLDRMLYKFVLIPRTKQALIGQRMIIDSALPPHGQMKTLETWVQQLRAPAYPLPVNGTLAAVGKPLFDKNCASCHSRDKPGAVIPVAEIGTDRQQLDQWANATGNSAEQQQMVKDGGYLTPALGGVWLRGPYLHNRSVPTTRDLLEPEAQRPRTFYPGDDLIDRDNLGFISKVQLVVTKKDKEGSLEFLQNETFPGYRPPPSPYDTTKPGNSNFGHLYGTGLSRPDKDALLEYLKTL